METSLFSTYSTGENRVTASLLAVLRSLSLPRIERLLGALMGQSDFELVRFQNQPSKGGAGVPDALISASATIFLETKIARNSVRAPQIRRHLKRLDKTSESTAKLLLLTPDDVEPASVRQVKDERLVWTGFTALDQAIDELLADKGEVVSEREAFLLRELQTMLVAEGLVASSNDVVIVAARRAWGEYQQYHAYVCQPNRAFQPTSRMGFYSDGQIYPTIPKIRKVYDQIEMLPGQHRGQLGKLVDRLITDGARDEEDLNKIFLLSPPDDSETEHLKSPVPNDLRSASGKPWAFTLGQRYVSFDKLKQAKATSDLVEE